jgi:replicative DNA helicase
VSNAVNRIPPHDASAEAAVLGAVFLRNDALDQVELRAEEFYDPRHREVFAAMRSLQAMRRPIDPVTLEGELVRTDKLAAIGGLSFLSELLDQVPTADNVAHYAAAVADAALKRRVIVAASEIAARGFRDDVGGEELLADFHGAASRIETPARDTVMSMRDAARETYFELEAAVKARDAGVAPNLALATGIATLDALLNGGFPRANMHIIAARPSMGKSALARGIAASVNRMGGGIHVFSPEDKRGAYVRRQIADDADLDLGRLTSMSIDRIEWARTIDACDGLMHRDRWLIDDQRSISIADIALKVKRRRKENQTKLVVIDYAQLLAGERGVRYESREHATSEIAKKAARLAGDEDVTVLLLSQLNRDSEKREDKRPTLADLRGSGELEQAADVVLMLHRPEWYLEKQRDSGNANVERQLELWRGKGQILLEKGKNMLAPNMTVLQWDAKSATYRDRLPRYREAA